MARILLVFAVIERSSARFPSRSVKKYPAAGSSRFNGKFLLGATGICCGCVQEWTGARSDAHDASEKEVDMRKTLFAIVAAAAMLGMVPMASAAQGCGRGWHRGYYGRCHPNRRRPVVIVPGRLVIGTYYPGRGWWDGHRYWVHRYRWHHGWRYR